MEIVFWGCFLPCLGVSNLICISNKFLGDVVAAGGPRTHFQNHHPKTFLLR